MTETPPYGLRFTNIPLLNLREEFKATRDFIMSPDAEQCLKPGRRQIAMPLFIWGGMPEDLMTLCLQRSILGVESYLRGAAFHTAAMLNVQDKNLLVKIRNPSRFEAKSFATNLYHRMPAAIHEELSLKHFDQGLYERNSAFYATVRNPIFHGQLIQSPEIAGVRSAFMHVDDLYAWIDSWHDPKTLLPPTLQVGPLVIRIPNMFLKNDS